MLWSCEHVTVDLTRWSSEVECVWKYFLLHSSCHRFSLSYCTSHRKKTVEVHIHKKPTTLSEKSVIDGFLGLKFGSNHIFPNVYNPHVLFPPSRSVTTSLFSSLNSISPQKTRRKWEKCAGNLQRFSCTIFSIPAIFNLFSCQSPKASGLTFSQTLV